MVAVNFDRNLDMAVVKIYLYLRMRGKRLSARKVASSKKNK